MPLALALYAVVRDGGGGASRSDMHSVRDMRFARDIAFGGDMRSARDIAFGGDMHFVHCWG